MQSVIPREVVEAAMEAVRPAAMAKDIQVRLDLPSGTDPITGDANRLQQIVWNLLSNAVKFTPPGGRVDVRLQRTDAHIQIVVSDTGAGISPDFLPHVFERFRQGDSSSTRTHGGLGLGLTLVKQLVELHGGSVRAESAGVGRGATFTLELPRRPARAPAGAMERHPPSVLALPLPRTSELKGVRLLVIDDDLDGVLLLTTILDRAGAAVEAARSAAEGFMFFTAAPPDVLISDIEMPGEDGYSLIARIRALEPEKGGRVPAIALTAYGRREDRLRAIAAGFSMHVPKPVDPGELLTLVASLAHR
jgi:CheY-like chemotaxis protein/anti-sigma regulatory factor (Ser/Thr protein kinase)